MALYKPIIQNDGVTTNYHRILFVDSIINSHVSIGVISYVNEEFRNKYQNAEHDSKPYTQVITYEIDYVKNMTAEDAYEYLKSLPEFKDAEDI